MQADEFGAAAGAVLAGLLVLAMLFVAGLAWHSKPAALLSIAGAALAFAGYQFNLWGTGMDSPPLLKTSAAFSLASWPCAVAAFLFLL